MRSNRACAGKSASLVFHTPDLHRHTGIAWIKFTLQAVLPFTRAHFAYPLVAVVQCMPQSDDRFESAHLAFNGVGRGFFHRRSV
jgi:hypothetical protein